jgi:hypothetical protein
MVLLLNITTANFFAGLRQDSYGSYNAIATQRLK